MTVPREVCTLLLVSFLVGFANVISHGQYFAPALWCVSVAFGVLVWSFVVDLRASTEVTQPRWKLPASLLWAALVSMPVSALLDPKTIAYSHGSRGLLRGLQGVSLLLLCTYLPFLGHRRESRFIRRTRFLAFGVLAAATGVVVLRLSPAPMIDVWDVQMRGARALLLRENPYVTVAAPVTFSDLEARGITENPYVYFPGALYVGVLGLLLGHDVRYAMLLSVLAAGAALATIARNRERGDSSSSLVEDAPVLSLWLTPLLSFVLEMAWLDPALLACTCIAVAAYLSGRRMLCAVAIGFALAAKQSMFWLLPLAGFALRFRPRDWILAAGICAAVVVPFAIADFRALKYGTFDFLNRLPPRDDALAAAVFVKRTFGVSLPTSVGFLTAAAVVVATALRARAMQQADDAAQRALHFARAATLTYFTFFFFNKWAFANYYFFIGGLASLATATAVHRA